MRKMELKASCSGVGFISKRFYIKTFRKELFQKGAESLVYVRFQPFNLASEIDRNTLMGIGLNLDSFDKNKYHSNEAVLIPSVLGKDDNKKKLVDNFLTVFNGELLPNRLYFMIYKTKPPPFIVQNDQSYEIEIKNLGNIAKPPESPGHLISFLTDSGARIDEQTYVSFTGDSHMFSNNNDKNKAPSESLWVYAEPIWSYPNADKPNVFKRRIVKGKWVQDVSEDVNKRMSSYYLYPLVFEGSGQNITRHFSSLDILSLPITRLDKYQYLHNIRYTTENRKSAFILMEGILYAAHQQDGFFAMNRMKRYNCISAVYNAFFRKNTLKNPTTQAALWHLLFDIAPCLLGISYDEFIKSEDLSSLKNLLAHRPFETEKCVYPIVKNDISQDKIIEYKSKFVKPLTESENFSMYRFFYSRRVLTEQDADSLNQLSQIDSNGLKFCCPLKKD